MEQTVDIAHLKQELGREMAEAQDQMKEWKEVEEAAMSCVKKAREEAASAKEEALVAKKKKDEASFKQEDGRRRMIELDCQSWQDRYAATLRSLQEERRQHEETRSSLQQSRDSLMEASAAVDLLEDRLAKAKQELAKQKVKTDPKKKLKKAFQMLLQGLDDDSEDTLEE